MFKTNLSRHIIEIDCDIVRAELHDLLDHELDPAEARAIISHLKSCESCSREAFLLYTTHALLKHLPDMQPGKEYWDFAARQVLRNIPAKKPEIALVS